MIFEETIRDWIDIPIYKCECDRCGVEFETANEFRSKFCSAECATKFNVRMNEAKAKLKAMGKTINDPALKYNDNYVGKKGYRTDPKGYVSIYNPDHANAMCNGFVAEHRLVMSDHIGRPLTDEEEVHHIDHDPDNNNIDNLVLCADHAQHGLLHRK